MQIFFVQRGGSCVLLPQCPRLKHAVCAHLLESSGRGRQDGPTEFLHGADGSREGWSREQRRHQVDPKDPGHHLLFTPAEGQSRAGLR